MSARVYTFPNLRIGSAAAMAVDPAAIRVRSVDRDAFLRVVEAREALRAARIDRFLKPDPAVTIVDGAADCAMRALRSLQDGRDIEDVRAHLALSAAMAIAALGEIEDRT